MQTIVCSGANGLGLALIIVRGARNPRPQTKYPCVQTMVCSTSNWLGLALVFV